MYNLEIQKEKRRVKSEIKFDFPIIHPNEEFLQILDELNIRFSKLIEQRNHNLLFRIFNHYLDCEIYLTERISGMKRKNFHNYHIRRYNELVELRDYYNNFRVLLVSQIAGYLIKVFTNIASNTNNDLLKSSQLFTYFKKTLKFYKHQIKLKIDSVSNKNPSLSINRIQQYKETLRNFLELESLLETLPKSKKTFFALLSI
jgi:hypothetical protein